MLSAPPQFSTRDSGDSPLGFLVAVKKARASGGNEASDLIAVEGPDNGLIVAARLTEEALSSNNLGRLRSTLATLEALLDYATIGLERSLTQESVWRALVLQGETNLRVPDAARAEDYYVKLRDFISDQIMVIAAQIVKLAVVALPVGVAVDMAMVGTPPGLETVLAVIGMTAYSIKKLLTGLLLYSTNQVLIQQSEGRELGAFPIQEDVSLREAEDASCRGDYASALDALDTKDGIKNSAYEVDCLPLAEVLKARLHEDGGFWSRLKDIFEYVGLLNVLKNFSGKLNLLFSG